MKEIANYLKNIFRIIFLWMLPLGLWSGSRRLDKWLRKNKKEQDPNLHPYDERWEYIRKKVRKTIWRIGVDIELIGEENLPKGASWIAPNHTSNFDPFYLIKALGGKIPLIPVGKEVLEKSKLVGGFFRGGDGFFISRAKIREQIIKLDAAAAQAKQTNHAVIVFPEGTRSLTGDLLDFKDGTFKFAQRYYLPIVPITIIGTLQARNLLRLKTAKIQIIVHKPLKAADHMHLPTPIISKKVKTLIQKDLTNYYKSLSPHEKKHLKNIKEKSFIKEKKKNKKLQQEINAEISSETE